MKNVKIAVLGDGGWGTTLAMLLCKKGLSVALWGAFPDYIDTLKKERENKKFLPEVKIPKDIILTADIKEAIDGAEAVVVAIPSQFLRAIVQRLRTVDLSSKIIISVVKGIEHETLKRPSEIIADELKAKDIVVLSGPTIAIEIAKGLPASAVVAAKNEKIAERAQEIFMAENFRIYTSADVAGVELGGALKNVIAIAAGVCDGLALGTNAKAALFTRGLTEMKRLGVALGAKEETFYGLSGIGDLLTTCISPYSRNRHVGEELARKKPLFDILKEMEMIAEGVETTRSIYELSKQLKIELPITEQVHKALFEAKDPRAAVSDLMSRSKKAE